MENAIAFSIFGVFVYWHGIIVALAAAAALITAVMLNKAQGGNASNVFTIAITGFVPAYVLGRVFYCYFAQAGFADKSDMLRLGKGGIALYGVAAGYILTAAVYCLIRKESLAKLTDALMPAAAIGIAIGRCASYFSNDDIGRTVSNVAVQHFPFAKYSSEYGEWRTSVFTFEAITAAVIFIVLIVPFYRKNISGKAVGMKDGDIAMLFMLLYGVSQTVFESLRSDSLLLITLGFVRASQVISIIIATLVFVIFSVRSAKKGITWMHYTGWSVSLCVIALAFWMEFCITSSNSVRNYSIMSLCLLIYLFIGLAMYFDSISEFTGAEKDVG